MRAKTGRVIGALVALLTVMKGLPLTYAKDMQEDKEPVFDAADAWALSLAAMAGMVRDMTPDVNAMRALAGGGFATATDLADWLVRVPRLAFRDAHHVTGRLVAAAEAKGVDLADLSLVEMQAVEPRITEEIFSVLTVEASVASRTSFGGTAPAKSPKGAALAGGPLHRPPCREGGAPAARAAGAARACGLRQEGTVVPARPAERDHLSADLPDARCGGRGGRGGSGGQGQAGGHRGGRAGGRGSRGAVGLQCLRHVRDQRIGKALDRTGRAVLAVVADCGARGGRRACRVPGAEPVASEPASERWRAAGGDDGDARPALCRCRPDRCWRSPCWSPTAPPSCRKRLPRLPGARPGMPAAPR